MRACLPLLLAALLVGCGDDVPLPEVVPLAAAPEELQQLYKFGPGPWQVGRVTGLELAHGRRDSQLRFKVYYPRGAEQAVPLLLFSHGNWSDFDQYDALLQHWVSHGYAVIAPWHMDGGGSYLSGTVNMVRYGNLGLIQAREDDLLTLLDQLDAVEALLPAEVPRFDRERIAATGHSFGAFNAQQLGGARPWDEDAGVFVGEADARIRAVVAISPPGPMFDEIRRGSWDEQRVPTLATTGTWDVNAMFWPDWRDHLLSWETARPGDQYALVVQGADHYLGGLICRLELDTEPQQDALLLVNNTVVAFLDAYLKDDPGARAFLNSSQIQDITDSFAVLDVR